VGERSTRQRVLATAFGRRGTIRIDTMINASGGWATAMVAAVLVESGSTSGRYTPPVRYERPRHSQL